MAELPAPILKWVGGKQSLLAQYHPFFPTQVNAYYEPFMGSAAIFFHLYKQGFAQKYVLSDANPELINVYCVVRDNVEILITLLTQHQIQHSKEHYYKVRAMDRAGLENYSAVERAARMLYLNRTCYNGLWRVNKKGRFNVPLGRYKNPNIIRAERLRAASEALQDATITHCSFTQAIIPAEPGDFVYFDPPYVPLSSTSNFTDYAAGGFGADQQRLLADTFRELDARGCLLMLSNSDAPLVHELYAGFRIETVYARRRINSNSSGRGAIPETLVLNY